MRAQDLMTADPVVTTPDEPVGRVAERMRDTAIHAVPVVNDPIERRLIGVITDRDLAVRHVALGHGPTCAVWEHMTTGSLKTVPPEADVAEVERWMRATRLDELFVTDPWGRLLGTISEKDLARTVGPAPRAFSTRPA